MRVVFAYDVSDDRLRSKVAALLAPHGVRLQRSVFECDLDGATLPELIRRVSDEIDHDRDVFEMFPQCSACRQSQEHLGQTRRELDKLYWIV
jgi:CRISPR-associated protein Cas2